MGTADLVGPTPEELADFAAALELKRRTMGSDVVFLQPAVVTFPPDTPVDDAGAALDPTVVPVSSAQASAVVRCGVFFKAVNRGGAEHADVATAVGLDDHTRIFAVAPISEAPKILGASQLIFHDNRFDILAIKTDEILAAYERILVYAAEAE